VEQGWICFVQDSETLDISKWKKPSLKNLIEIKKNTNRYGMQTKDIDYQNKYFVKMVSFSAIFPLIF
jgi:hypothetical protein